MDIQDALYVAAFLRDFLKLTPMEFIQSIIRATPKQQELLRKKQNTAENILRETGKISLIPVLGKLLSVDNEIDNSVFPERKKKRENEYEKLRIFIFSILFELNYLPVIITIILQYVAKSPIPQPTTPDRPLRVLPKAQINKILDQKGIIDLSYCDLTNSDMHIYSRSKSIFKGAKFAFTRFPKGMLFNGFDLSDADFSNAILHEANLDSVMFSEKTNLNGADFTGAVLLFHMKLSKFFILPQKVIGVMLLLYLKLNLVFLLWI